MEGGPLQRTAWRLEAKSQGPDEEAEDKFTKKMWKFLCFDLEYYLLSEHPLG